MEEDHVPAANGATPGGGSKGRGEGFEQEIVGSSGDHGGVVNDGVFGYRVAEAGERSLAEGGGSFGGVKIGFGDG